MLLSVHLCFPIFSSHLTFDYFCARNTVGNKGEKLREEQEKTKVFDIDQQVGLEQLSRRPAPPLPFGSKG